jgi:hypothetical protein
LEEVERLSGDGEPGGSRQAGQKEWRFEDDSGRNKMVEGLVAIPGLEGLWRGFRCGVHEGVGGRLEGERVVVFVRWRVVFVGVI